MINMISIDTFENYETPNKLTDTSDGEVKFDEFSALLAAFSFAQAEIKLPVKMETSETTPIGEIQSLPEEIGQTEVSENSAQQYPIQNFAPSIPLKASEFILPKPENVPTDILQIVPNQLPQNNVETKISEIKPFTNTMLPQKIEQSKISEISDNQKAVQNTVLPTALATPPVISSTHQITETDFPKVLPAQLPQNQFELKGFENKLPTNPPSNQNTEKKFSQKQLIRQTLIKLNTSTPTSNDFQMQVLLPQENVEIIPDSLSQNSRLPEPPQILNPIVNRENNFIVNLSQLFRGISKDSKGDKTETTSKSNESASRFGFTFSETENIAATTSRIKSVQHSLMNTTTETFGQSILETAKSDIKTTENLSLQTFENLFSAVGKDVKNVEAAPIAVDREKVFEQVATHLERETLILTNEIDKPNILKLRLRPAELGTVEIRLEKSASGKLIAHFQTESETTRQILVERFDDLQNALQNAGWQVEKLDVTCHSFLSAGNENRGEQSRESETVANISAETDKSEKVSLNTDDSIPNRLVSLRA